MYKNLSYFHNQGLSELDLSALILSELDVPDSLYPLIARNNQTTPAIRWRFTTGNKLKSWINLTVCTVLQLAVDSKQWQYGSTQYIISVDDGS